MRAVLLDIDPDDHVFLLYAHHIVADGLSLAVLCDELADHYAGRGLPQPAPTTRDRRPADLARQLEYWKQQLHGVRPLDLPLDRPRAAVRDNGGSRLRSTMSGELRDAVRALAREEGATQFVALLAAFQVLLGRWAGTEDVAIGSPVSARSAPELERVVGYLVTMATFRGDLSGDPSFRELLRRTRDVAFGALANSDVPFTSVVAELAPERDQSRPPIFSATLVSQPTPPTLVADLGDVTGVSFPVPRRYSTYDLTLYAWDAPDELIIDIEYATALFDTSTARRLAEQFARLVEGAVAAPDAPLSTLEILPEPELRKVVRDWNDTAAAFALDRPVHELVTAQVQRAPDRIAVVEGDREVTYAELHDRATVLARRLREHGVGPDVVVAVRSRAARLHDHRQRGAAAGHRGGGRRARGAAARRRRTGRTRVHCGRPRVRDLHLGLDGRAQGRAGTAPGNPEPDPVDAARVRAHRGRRDAAERGVHVRLLGVGVLRTAGAGRARGAARRRRAPRQRPAGRADRPPRRDHGALRAVDAALLPGRTGTGPLHRAAAGVQRRRTAAHRARRRVLRALGPRRAAQPVRADRDQRGRHALAGRAGRGGGGHADRPSDRQHHVLRARRPDAPAADRRAGRTAHRRRAAGARLPRQTGADGGAVRSRPVRPARRQAVPHR